MKYVSGWIDADDDGEITREYEEEVLIKVESCGIDKDGFLLNDNVVKKTYSLYRKRGGFKWTECNYIT